MNAFYEHHKDSIRFGYRCFDRILLNGLIQPFQQPERGVGFFSTYRQLHPVSRQTLRGIAEQFQHCLKAWSGKRNIPILDAPQGRHRRALRSISTQKSKPVVGLLSKKSRELVKLLSAVAKLASTGRSQDMSTRTTRIGLAACLAGAVAPWLLGGTAFAAPDNDLTQVAVIALPASGGGGGHGGGGGGHGGGGGGFHAPGGLNSFDIGFVDPAIHTYVLADRTNKAVDVVDTENNTFTKYLPANFVGNCADVVPRGVPASFCTNASGPNGVIISDHKEVWATDAPPFRCSVGPPATCTLTSTSSVKGINLKPENLITTHTGGNKRTDELCEDPRHEVVLAANNAPSDNFLTFISPETHKILGKITFDGKDPRGDKIFAKASSNANGIRETRSSIWPYRTSAEVTVRSS